MFLEKRKSIISGVEFKPYGRQVPAAISRKRRMIFDRGGFGLQRVRQWPEELGSLEWVSDGVGFLAAKNAKFAKAWNLR